jgi:hypothetical protein
LCLSCIYNVLINLFICRLIHHIVSSTGLSSVLMPFHCSLRALLPIPTQTSTSHTDVWRTRLSTSPKIYNLRQIFLVHIGHNIIASPETSFVDLMDVCLVLYTYSVTSRISERRGWPPGINIKTNRILAVRNQLRGSHGRKICRTSTHNHDHDTPSWNRRIANFH